jgi:hypothetical protein
LKITVLPMRVIYIHIPFAHEFSQGHEFDHAWLGGLSPVICGTDIHVPHVINAKGTSAAV